MFMNVIFQGKTKGMFKMEEYSFHLGVFFGHVSSMMIFYKSTKHSILSELLTMEERLEKLITDIEAGVFSSPSEVHRLGQSFYAELRQLADSCKDSE